MKYLRLLTEMWFLLCFIFGIATAIETRAGRDKPSTIFGPQTRIIGGTDAAAGRYPYMVSLLNGDGTHACGGSLVAPDVVLTAAHCKDVLKYAQIGRYDRSDTREDYEQFEILYPEYLHPQYDEEEFPYDFMLLKLGGQSRKQYVLVNDDNTLPSGNANNELTVMGFGITEAGEPTSEPDILQEVRVTYVPNNVCEEAKDPRVPDDYQGLISSDMLCARDSGEDACQGDSGGPLVIGRGNPQRDILVGVVSWGYGCASENFPGVYSRISHQIDWIRSTICRIASAPPSEIDCSRLDTPDGTIRSVPITIILQFDDYPVETGWSVRNKQSEAILVEVPPGTYETSRSRVSETVFLPAGASYIFQIEDTFGDGLCCTTPGNYVVVLGRNPNGEDVLATGGGDFGRRTEHAFNIPVNYEEPDTDFDPIIGEGQIPLTIVIQLDNYPQEVGWRVDRLGIEVEEVIRIPAGIYVTPFAIVTRTIILEEGELYYFRIYDVMEDGIGSGYVQLFLGTTDSRGNKQMILEEDGQFGGGLDISFVASFETEQTEAPIVVGNSFLTLELRFDQYPEEIAIQLRISDSETAIERQASGTVIFFRPPRYYADYAEKTVVETISIPDISPGGSRQFTFIITDSYGDGLCCNWAGAIEPGFTLYKGEKLDGVVLSTSNFEASAREVATFRIEGPQDGGSTLGPGETGTVAPTEPLPTAEIKVTITLDIYPDETGFYILDESGSKVVDFPPGTYREPNEVIEEVFTVEVGVYTFAIVDVFGDGLNLENPYYSVSLNGEDTRPALIAGDGSFFAEEQQIFIVEGSTATYPLNIRFFTDSLPKETGFYIQRIDLPRYDAFVASIPQGTYEAKNKEVKESILLREGGLYRIVFEDSGQNGIGGLISVSHGSGSNAKSFSIDGNTFHEMRVKVFAGRLRSTAANPKTLSLRFQFDRFPHEIEWVILWNTPSNSEVVAYGPPSLYDQSVANTELVETIALPAWGGDKIFTMIVSDSAGDGVCCDFGDGGPVELFDGSVEEGVLLLADSMEGKARWAESFLLVGNGEEDSAAGHGLSFAAASIVALGLLIDFII